MRRLTVAQAAEIAHCSTDTIYRALHLGELIGHQRGKNSKWLIKPEALEAWMDGTPYDPAATVVPLRRKAVAS